jgi:hypothetical protein
MKIRDITNRGKPNIGRSCLRQHYLDVYLLLKRSLKRFIR